MLGKIHKHVSAVRAMGYAPATAPPVSVSVPHLVLGRLLHVVGALLADALDHAHTSAPSAPPTRHDSHSPTTANLQANRAGEA